MSAFVLDCDTASHYMKIKYRVNKKSINLVAASHHAQNRASTATVKCAKAAHTSTPPRTKPVRAGGPGLGTAVPGTRRLRSTSFLAITFEIP